MLNIFRSRLRLPRHRSVGTWLLRRGVTPNAVTLVGTRALLLAALWFIPRGQLFGRHPRDHLFVLFDLLDGAGPRASGSGTRFGAVLDASL